MSDPIETSVGGATVTVNPKPDAEAPASAILSGGNDGFLVTDERGRTFRLKKPGVLAQFHLVEALGPISSNQVYMGMVLPLLFVVSIDGEAVVKPGSKAEVEALIIRLDEDGVQAVMEGVQKHFGVTDETTAKNG